LSPAAPEAQQGFIINHLIADHLPDRGDGWRYPNADPVTGQAAWFDLRVRLEKAAPDEAGEIEPKLEPITPPPSIGTTPHRLRYGAGFRGRPGADYAGNSHSGRIIPAPPARRGRNGQLS